MSAGRLIAIVVQAFVVTFAIVTPMFAWMGMPSEVACWSIVAGGASLALFCWAAEAD